MIPYGRHCIDQSDIDAVVEVLKSDWLTTGPAINVFERALESIVGAKYAISCSNGTTALHLAMMAIGVGPGDTVLVPAITFLASANAARYVGADVAFVDVDPLTGLMTAETLKEAILRNANKQLKAIVNVHLAGQCENLKAIRDISKNYGLFIIEDAAHAVGTKYIEDDGTISPIGANKFSDLTTFSFHPVKTIATGEGGAVTTNDPIIAEKLKLYRSHGMIRDPSQWETKDSVGPWYYEMHDLGYNYRISDINCALGIAQLRKLENYKSERLKLVKNYDEFFKGAQAIRPMSKLMNSDTAWHLYVVYIDFQKIAKSRVDIMDNLKSEGIGAQVHYIPLYKQPYYKKLYGNLYLEGAETYYERCLSLPLFSGLTEKQQHHIVKVLTSYVA